MSHLHSSMQEDSDLVKVLNLFKRNYKLFLGSVIVMVLSAFVYNHYSKPIYLIKSSLMIKEEKSSNMGNAQEYINQDLFGKNQGFQNELFVLKSSPVIEQTVRNLDLTINYFINERFKKQDAYKMVPFKVLLLKDHVQPANVIFTLAVHKNNTFTIKAKEGDALITNLYKSGSTHIATDWKYETTGKFGTLLETKDLAFVINRDSIVSDFIPDELIYEFVFSTVSSMTHQVKSRFNFIVPERDATVVQIEYRTASYLKGLDIVSEMMDVYGIQNVNRKNHIAEVTIEYIENQLDEISDSLNQTESNLQHFRSSRQLLDVNDQAAGMSAQYMQLQNQMAELVTSKRYYDYLEEYLSGENDISNIIVPTSMGVKDEMLNNLVTELITIQNQRANLIRNHQEKNPLVQRLGVQIENAKNTIYENIKEVKKTTDIAMDELNKRINAVKGEISRVPQTQRQLGGIERNYRLNDAIYNYLLEKRAEAKISQASNQPDNVIIEPASLIGVVAPNTRNTYLLALALGLALPYALLLGKGLTSEKIGLDERIERYTDAPLLGKIPHSRKKSNNGILENQNSGLSEAYRALRTNIEFHYKDRPHQLILITSSIEGEGKSFNAMNIAISYAQLGKKTILLDLDLRKSTPYFQSKDLPTLGLSSFFNGNANLDEIVLKTPHEKLDFIQSGPIPPNPVEMLASDTFPELLEYLKKHYDYIIIDSTPLAQVADAYLLMDHVDLKLIIARYNYGIKKIFQFVMDDLKSKNVPNLAIVMNDFRSEHSQYGYGYGYGYGKKKKK
jgi:tyrosine-protein kinase Etk/Wzc